MRISLKVVLITVSPARQLFFSHEVRQETPGADAAETSGTGPWARLERWFHRTKERWAQSQGAAARGSRTVWEWLHSRTHPDEVLYSRLRIAGRIELFYPESMDAQSVTERWSLFLRAGRIRHWPWFAVNVALAPISVVLAPLPGPNLIGYWFAYRAVHHLLILRGLGRVRAGRVPITCHAAEVLDRPIEDDGEAERVAVAFGCEPAELFEFLQRQGVPVDHPAPSVNEPFHDR
ncbi:MAG: hypothetical protein U0794_19095 [Isosphaeraceae bacterium]